MLRHDRLLKRASSEAGVARRVKRCRLSSVNFFRQPNQRALAHCHDLPYFVPNMRWQTIQASIPVPPLVPQPDTAAPGTHVSLQPPPHSRDLTLYKQTGPLTLPRLLRIYGQLSKARLTSLIVLTAMSGVALSPLPTTVPILLSTALGTALCSASANTFNQLAEVPFDAQMARTRPRPLVRGAISPTHAASFALATGIAGPSVLFAFANPVSAFLGAANIGLYAIVYTRLKRVSITNTWVGAIVGAIPPLIGWTACGGQLLPSASYPIHVFPPTILSDLATSVPLEYVDNPLSALALCGLLFSWQFPHFNPLSYMVREAYAQGGYKMLCVVNPALNTLVSLRHAIALTAICSILTPLSGLTTWTFAVTSLGPNVFLVRAAWRFWKEGSEKAAKSLWNTSLWYLPVILGLMMLHKRGVEWQSFTWREREKLIDGTHKQH